MTSLFRATAVKTWLGMLLTCAALLAAPAHAGWSVAETAHFRLYSQESPAKLRERAAVLEDFHRLLQSWTNAEAAPDDAPRLDIYLVPRIADAKPFGKVARDVAGYYTATVGRIAAFGDLSDMGQIVLLHEYSHHFMLGSAGVAYPAWYVEGFAEYFSTATFRPDRIELGRPTLGRAQWLAYAKWLPLERIVSRDSGLHGTDDTQMFYAESWALTHYMFRTPEMQPKFKAYLQHVAKGNDSLEAFRREIDPNPAAFQRKLDTYINQHGATYSRVTRVPPPAASIIVTALPASADTLLLPLVSVELGSIDDKAAALAAIRKAAARYPDDDFARRALAFAELRLGDRQTAIVLLEPLLAAAPTDATLLRWRAKAENALGPESTAAKRDAARRYLVRAYKADPSDWRTLLDYVRLANPQAGPLNKATLDVALRAYELAPQVAEVAVTTAVALAQADRLPEAAKVLEPIAYSPHPSDAAAIARVLMASAAAGDKPGFLAVLANPSAAIAKAPAP